MSEMKINPKRVYQVRAYGEGFSLKGSMQGGGFKSLTDCVVKVINGTAKLSDVRYVAILDVKSMQSARYKVILCKDKKEGFILVAY